MEEEKQDIQTQKMITRQVFYFTCEKCGHSKRQTFKRSRAEVGLCKPCRREALLIHKNQTSLFAST